MSDTKKTTKPTIVSDQYRRFAADTFNLRVNDNIAQLTFLLETTNERDEEIVVREATIVLTPRSLKVLQLILSGVVENIETHMGNKIPLSAGKEEELKALAHRKAK